MEIVYGNRIFESVFCLMLAVFLVYALVRRDRFQAVSLSIALNGAAMTLIASVLQSSRKMTPEQLTFMGTGAVLLCLGFGMGWAAEFVRRRDNAREADVAAC